MERSIKWKTSKKVKGLFNMPKKRSSKTSVEVEEATIAESTKPSSTPKKSSSQSGDIFTGKKSNKSEKRKNDKVNENGSEKPKSLKKVEESTIVESKKPSSTPKKPISEIDAIFAGKKRKKPEKQKNDKVNGNETDKPKYLKKKKTKEDKEGRFTDPPSRPQKKTEDGINIYTEEELGINNSNAGGTPLCPFDCDCCF